MNTIKIETSIFCAARKYVGSHGKLFPAPSLNMMSSKFYFVI